jgi:hypothetical protein
MKKLQKSAGKFIYPKGSSLLTHFMHLQNPSLEPALNYSLLTALHTARVRDAKDLLLSIEIQKWRYCLLTEKFVDLVKACHFGSPVFHDSESDYALIYEEIKLRRELNLDFKFCMHSENPEKENDLATFYTRDRESFEVHNSILGSFDFSDRSVLLLNTVLGVRPGHEMPPYLGTLALGRAQGAVIALRASESGVDLTRTSIHGEDFVVPCLASIKRWMDENGRQWYWRYLAGHDKDFFIPEPDAPDVGVILAYTSKLAEKSPGFRLLTEGES